MGQAARAGRVLVIKGYESGTAPIGQPSAVEVTGGGKKIKRGVKVWPVATGMLKSEFYGWLKLERPSEESGEPYPSGYAHFPQMPEEFFRQLTAEQLIPRIVKGYRKLEWVKTRERNESLDCRVYARAAAAQYGIDRFVERHWAALESQIGSAKRDVAPTAPADRAERVVPAFATSACSPDYPLVVSESLKHVHRTATAGTARCARKRRAPCSLLRSRDRVPHRGRTESCDRGGRSGYRQDQRDSHDPADPHFHAEGFLKIAQPASTTADRHHAADASGV